MNEFDWIEKHSRHLQMRHGVRLGIGDDAAILGSLQTPVVTCDCLVENVHFRREWTTPRDLARKALSVNLSDIAAMGARPIAAFVSLTIPPDLNELFWDEFYLGLEEIAAQFHFTIAGGDTTRTQNGLVINVTIVGEAFPQRNENVQNLNAENAKVQNRNANAQTQNAQFVNTQNIELKNENARNENVQNVQLEHENAEKTNARNEDLLIESSAAITRSGAQVGDILVVTGTLGDSAAALHLLQNPQIEIAASSRAFLLRRHFDPTPRLREMQIARKMGGVRAALDLSDGLAGDAQHIARRSALTLEIETDKLPISNATFEMAQAVCNQAVCEREKPHRVLDEVVTNWALGGGEDYELLLCIAPERAEETIRQIAIESGTRATTIGRCVASSDDEHRVVLRNQSGQQIAAPRAWTHF